jgi:hypothetical protein
MRVPSDPAFLLVIDVVQGPFGEKRFLDLRFDVGESNFLGFLILEIEKGRQKNDAQEDGPDEILHFFFHDDLDQPDDTKHKQGQHDIFKSFYVHLCLLAVPDEYFSRKRVFFLYFFS